MYFHLQNLKYYVLQKTFRLNFAAMAHNWVKNHILVYWRPLLGPIEKSVRCFVSMTQALDSRSKSSLLYDAQTYFDPLNLPEKSEFSAFLSLDVEEQANVANFDTYKIHTYTHTTSVVGLSYKIWCESFVGHIVIKIQEVKIYHGIFQFFWLDPLEDASITKMWFLTQMWG